MELVELVESDELLPSQIGSTTPLVTRLYQTMRRTKNKNDSIVPITIYMKILPILII